MAVVVDEVVSCRGSRVRPGVAMKRQIAPVDEMSGGIGDAMSAVWHSIGDD